MSLLISVFLSKSDSAKTSRIERIVRSVLNVLASGISSKSKNVQDSDAQEAYRKFLSIEACWHFCRNYMEKPVSSDKSVITKDEKESAASELQRCLFDMLDLSQQGKQAHWNVTGVNFRSVHLQLDEIASTAQTGGDDIAERIATLGFSPAGNAAAVASNSRLAQYPTGFQSFENTVAFISESVTKSVSGLREARQALSKTDVVSEGLVIELTAELEKHLWMLRVQIEKPLASS